MANTLSNELKKTSTKPKEDSKKIENAEIAALKTENREIKDQLNAIMQLLIKQNQPCESTEGEEIKSYHPYDNFENNIPEEPNSNRMISVMSLCFGTLNLSEDPTGKGLVTFSKYGEVKKIMYSSLVNIVNYNRNFAEKGYFYILDKATVYHLSLMEFYEHLSPKEVLDNICEYPDSQIIGILDTMNDVQLSTLCESLQDRLYGGEKLDLNKINLISKKSNIDILEKVKEMESFNK